MNPQALLQWQHDMGVDEAIALAPVNRLRAKKPAASTEPASQTTPEPRSALAATPKPAPLANTTPSLPANRKEGLNKAKTLAANAESLSDLHEAIKNFDGCPLQASAKHTVFADGSPDSHIMIIGEAPNSDEDRQGTPFCGKTGELLDKMLASIGLSRQENCYLTNMIFWRPPGNRKPSTEEIQLCDPFIQRHIALFNPKIIIAAGATPANHLTGDNRGIARLRGKFHDITLAGHEKKYPLLPIYHPSYLMRQLTHKRLAWQDLLMLKARLQDEGLLKG